MIPLYPGWFSRRKWSQVSIACRRTRKSRMNCRFSLSSESVLDGRSRMMSTSPGSRGSSSYTRPMSLKKWTTWPWYRCCYPRIWRTSVNIWTGKIRISSICVSSIYRRAILIGLYLPFGNANRLHSEASHRTTALGNISMAPCYSCSREWKD